MAPSDFAHADLHSIVEQLTHEEAILLTAGVGLWRTRQIERLGIPSIKVSDGPNGIRGTTFFMGTPAKCLPCETALGATWDPKLIEKVGRRLLAEEAKLRAASVVLAPTCNIQRHPLSARSFESFSEDSTLSGLMAAAYVRGTQSGGVGACIKHFVANDKDNDRMAYDSVMSPRALREVYLMPFMLAEKYSQPWCYMTACNRVNGIHCSENQELLRNILRGEWKSKAMVMSDWFSTHSVDLALNAGLDLEMPGTNKWRSIDLVTRTIRSRKLLPRTLKECAKNVLRLVQACAAGAPEVIDGDGQERSVDTEEDRDLMRQVASQSIVLLKNEGGLLPIRPSDQGVRKVAIVGGNAKAIALSGGGSAALKPSYFVSPFDGLVNALGENVEIAYAEGATSYFNLPSLDFEVETDNGERGLTGTWFAHEHDDSVTLLLEPFGSPRTIDETYMFFSDEMANWGLTNRWSLHIEGKLKPRDRDCEFEFGLTVAGRAKLFVDDQLVIDNWTRQRRGQSFFGSGSIEERGRVQLRAGHAARLRIEYNNVRGPADGDEDLVVVDIAAGLQLGGTVVADPDADAAIEEAVRVAKEADVAIAIVGLSAQWETEGVDRSTLALPGRTDELIESIVAVNPKTIVVVQAGSPVTMPWADKVPSIMHTWYLGNATGDAIADVLTGNVNPSGKLPLTFPKRLEDVPAHGHFNSENGVVRYSEDIFVGYKGYALRKIEPMWAFGHGLSYTTFEYSDLQLSEPSVMDHELSLSASVLVKNTGAVPGAEIVQLYVTLPKEDDPAPAHVPLALRAFKKTDVLAPSSDVRVELALDKYAVSMWDERIRAWVVAPGTYHVQVGQSSVVLPLHATFQLERGFEWNGL